ncbi:MAG: TonB-dependent receptor [Zhongshania sp.]|nr:TonB-dependent receptor [Zhongshania sp.]
MKKSRGILFLLPMMFAGEAYPQSAAKTPAIEEVIITAQRREENAQDVAISVTVFNQEQIANANMINSSDIATYTPSLTVDTRFGNENTSFAIRGFTQSLRTTASVATYFADVVAPRGAVAQTSGDGAGPGTLFDLANIQVLKGPQGTLFGRNTTGGAILLVPNKPSEEYEGYVEFSAGELGSRRQQVVANFPVSDNFKVRFGLDQNERDGHLNNITGVGARKLGNTEYLAARLSLVWDITDSIENYTILTYVDSESTGYTATLFDCNTDQTVVDNPFALTIGSECVRQLEMQEATGQDGFYDLVSTVKTPITTIKEKRFINTTTWEIDENLTAKGIIAYAHLEGTNGSDIFGTRFQENVAALLGFGLPLGLVDPRREISLGASVVNPDFPSTSQQTWVGELQLQGVALDSRMIWQAGLYHENSTPDGFSGQNAASLLYCDLSTIETSDPSQFNCFDPLLGIAGGVLIFKSKTEFLNQAVYGQATYDVLPQLSTTLGLRYTWDETKGEGVKERYAYLLSDRQAPVFSRSTPEVKSEAPTGFLEFNYRPIDDVMLYTKYTRGYRQGSVNVASDPGLDTHEHETVDTYEIGAKTTFGGPVPGRVNIAVFHNDLKDMQLQIGYNSASSGPTTGIVNAGEAEINGFEVEAYFQLFEPLSLSISYSQLDTELLKQSDVDPADVERAVTEASGNPLSGQIAASTFVPIAAEGDELPYAPESSWVATLKYQLPVSADIGLMDVGVTYTYTGEQRAAASNSTPHDVLPDYNLLNVNASWLGVLGSNFDLTLFGTNILDEQYLTYVSGTYVATGIESRQVGFPKMYGARLRYSF